MDTSASQLAGCFNSEATWHGLSCPAARLLQGALGLQCCLGCRCGGLHICCGDDIVGAMLLRELGNGSSAGSGHSYGRALRQGLEAWQ